MIKTEELGGTSLEPTGGFSHVDILVASQRFMTTIAGVKDLEGANVATTLAELAEISEDHVFLLRLLIKIFGKLGHDIIE